VPQASWTTKKSGDSNLLRWKQGAVIPAFVAMLTLLMFRTDQHRWLPALFMEGVIFTLLPVLSYCLIRKWARKNPESVSRKQIKYLAQATALFSVLALISWKWASRSIGLGEANEMVALMVIQVVSWTLAVFASVRGFERASFVLCGALVFFVCCMTKRVDIFVAGALFAVASLWWMAGIYWSKLDSKAIDGNPKMLAIHGSSTLISVIVVAVGVGLSLLIPFSRGQYSLQGYMPFSGGEDGYQDEFAGSGVGDGNMLMAGNNATTTGAVDTDQFIEDDKPSLYDVMSEKYDGPVFKKKRNRAVALEAKAKHIHEVKQSEQSGRSFRTMRNSERELDIDYEDRISNALFQVEGTVPARFILDAFHHFDGWDWTKTSIEEETPVFAKINLNRSKKPIFKLSRFKSDYLTGSRSHRVKVMRLETASLPAPCFLDRWHISRVDKVDFFCWGEAGVVCYNSEMIPPQTVIDFKSYIPNYHIMRSASDLRHNRKVSSWEHKFDKFLGVAREAGDPSLQKGTPPVVDAESPFLQVPDNDSHDRIAALADEITSCEKPGWNQVEAIVNHMREEFELNPAGWKADEEAEDTVGYFLDNNGGPSEQFATSCAMLLRSAGYRTRLASGFLVREKDYIRRAKQSIVTTENLHMWPEVCLDGRFWIPVEPTPGYPIPYSTETAWQWVMAKAQAVIGWIWRNPLLALLIATMVALCYRYRANLITSLMLGWWNIVRLAWPPLLLRTTRQLIDLRFWAAGDRRPQSKTIRNWYMRVEPELSTSFFDLWNATNYCSSPQKVSHGDLIAKCREQVELLTLGRIQKNKTNTKGNS